MTLVTNTTTNYGMISAGIVRPTDDYIYVGSHLVPGPLQKEAHLSGGQVQILINEGEQLCLKVNNTTGVNYVYTPPVGLDSTSMTIQNVMYVSNTPTPTPTATPTPTVTPTMTQTPTPTMTQTPTVTPTMTQTPTPTSTPLPPTTAYFQSCCDNNVYKIGNIPSVVVITIGNTYYVESNIFTGCTTAVSGNQFNFVGLYTSITSQPDCNTCYINESYVCPTPTPTVTPTKTPTPTPTNTPSKPCPTVSGYVYAATPIPSPTPSATPSIYQNACVGQFTQGNVAWNVYRFSGNRNGKTSYSGTSFVLNDICPSTIPAMTLYWDNGASAWFAEITATGVDCATLIGSSNPNFPIASGTTDWVSINTSNGCPCSNYWTALNNEAYTPTCLFRSRLISGSTYSEIQVLCGQPNNNLTISPLSIPQLNQVFGYTLNPIGSLLNVLTGLGVQWYQDSSLTTPLGDGWYMVDFRINTNNYQRYYFQILSGNIIFQSIC
jgi:hypothetical protein